MTIEEKIFERETIDFSKLEPYGFKKSNNTYIFEKTFMDGAFKAVISVSPKGVIKGDVYDVDTGDAYFQMRIDEIAIGYAALVRSAYIEILKDIADHCCTQNLFTSAQGNRLVLRLKQKYGDSPLFPWEKYPTFGIFKNPDSEKWYALIMSIEFEKLDAKKSGSIEVINLKIDDQRIPQLVKKNGIYPAYHMNKKYWITVVLNDSLDDETLLSLIDESHAFTLGKHKKSSAINQWIIPANPKFFDIVATFEKEDEIIWKQSSGVHKGDIAYMYVAAPYSAILYQCLITKTDIPYHYQDKNIKITHVMKIKKLKQYDKNFLNFEKLKTFGVTAVRGPRSIPQKLAEFLF